MVSPNAIKVNLPKTGPTPPEVNNDPKIHIAVTKDRKYFVNNTEIPKEALEAEISKLASKQLEPVVLMHLDKELSIQEEIDVMTICYRLKCKTVLATAATENK